MLKISFLFSLFGKKAIHSDRFVSLSTVHLIVIKTLILILPFLNTSLSYLPVAILLMTTQTNSFGHGLI